MSLFYDLQKWPMMSLALVAYVWIEAIMLIQMACSD